MLNTLQAKRKSGFVKGTIKKPGDDHADYENWMTVNSMIIDWIRVSIEPKVRSTVTFIADASQLWSNLKQRFSVHNKLQLHQLKGQIATCTQEGQSVLDYYVKLSSLWEEYALDRPLLTCTCGVAETLSKEREEDKVHDLLLGLDDARYGSLCTTIIGLYPLPYLEEVYSKAIHEEQRILSSRSRESQQDALGLTTRSNQQQDASSAGTATSKINNQLSPKPDTILRTRDLSMLCSHCGRNGHEKRDCLQIVGYPEWWTEHNKQSSHGRGAGRGGGRGRTQQAAAHATSANSSVL